MPSYTHRVDTHTHSQVRLMRDTIVLAPWRGERSVEEGGDITDDVEGDAVCNWLDYERCGVASARGG